MHYFCAKNQFLRVFNVGESPSCARCAAFRRGLWLCVLGAWVSESFLLVIMYCNCTLLYCNVFDAAGGTGTLG